MSQRNNKQEKHDKTSVLKTVGIVLFWVFLKIPYYIFIWLCYLIVFGNLAALIGGFIIGDFGVEGKLSGTVGSIILVSLLLFILSFITRKVVVNTFEFFMFGDNFGIPTGIALITALILVIFVSLLQLVHIEMNTFLVIVLVIVSLLLSIPIFKRFANWYRKKKELRLQKEENKRKTKNKKRRK